MMNDILNEFNTFGFSSDTNKVPSSPTGRNDHLFNTSPAHMSQSEVMSNKKMSWQENTPQTTPRISGDFTSVHARKPLERSSRDFILQPARFQYNQEQKHIHDTAGRGSRGLSSTKPQSPGMVRASDRQWIPPTLAVSPSPQVPSREINNNQLEKQHRTSTTGSNNSGSQANKSSTVRNRGEQARSENRQAASAANRNGQASSPPTKQATSPPIKHSKCCKSCRKVRTQYVWVTLLAALSLALNCYLFIIVVVRDEFNLSKTS